MHACYNTIRLIDIVSILAACALNSQRNPQAKGLADLSQQARIFDYKLLLLQDWARAQAYCKTTTRGRELEEGKRPPPPRQESASGLY